MSFFFHLVQNYYVIYMYKNCSILWKSFGLSDKFVIKMGEPYFEIYQTYSEMHTKILLLLLFLLVAPHFHTAGLSFWKLNMDSPMESRSSLHMLQQVIPPKL